MPDKNIETQHQKDKKKKLHKFDIHEHKDFISDISKRKYNHLCYGCMNKYKCFKGKNAIILICSEYQQKGNPENRGRNEYK